MVIWPVCHAAVTAENAAHVEDTHMQSYTCIAMHRSRGQGLLAALTQGSFTPEEVRSIACGLTASAVCCSTATPGSAAPCPNQGILCGRPTAAAVRKPKGEKTETELSSSLLVKLALD